MKIISKLKNNNGSAMILAIILMLLVSIVIVMFSSQISNVFKVTNRNYEDLRIKYMLEAGIENAIGTTLTNIEYEYLDGTKYSDWKVGKNIVFEQPNGTKVETIYYPLSVKIKDDEIKNKLNYTLEETNIDIKLNIDKYEIEIQNYKKLGKSDKSQEAIVYKYYIRSTDSQPQDIVANTKYNGKNHSMTSKIKFYIEDLKTGKVNYTVKSWD